MGIHQQDLAPKYNDCLHSQKSMAVKCVPIGRLFTPDVYLAHFGTNTGMLRKHSALVIRCNTITITQCSCNTITLTVIMMQPFGGWKR